MISFRNINTTSYCNYYNNPTPTKQKTNYIPSFKGIQTGSVSKLSNEHLEKIIELFFNDLHYNFKLQYKRRAVKDFVYKLIHENISIEDKIIFFESFAKRALKTGEIPFYSPEALQKVCSNKTEGSKLFTPYLKEVYNNPDFPIKLKENATPYEFFDNDGNLVATLGLYKDYIAGVWVNPLVRGSKTSGKALRALFKKAEETALANGYNRVSLEVFPDNKKAIEGYLYKQGFLVSAFSPKYKKIPMLEKTLKEGILSAEEIEYRQGLTKNLLEYMESLIQEKNINLIV